MRTFEVIPKKYSWIKSGHIEVIGSYAYAVYRQVYSGQRDYVYRITKEKYHKLREEAKYWDGYTCAPYEWNMQLQIWIYICDDMQNTPYIQTAKHI